MVKLGSLAGGAATAAGLLMAGLAVALDHEALWRFGIVIAIAGLSAISMSSLLTQRSLKRDAALTRDRTRRIAEQSQRTGRRTDEINQNMTRGDMATVPIRVERNEAAAKRIEAALVQMRSALADLGDDAAEAFTDRESLREESRALHELILSNVLENRLRIENHDEKTDAGLAVLESQGRSGWKRLLEGSESIYQTMRHNFDSHYQQVESLLAIADLLPDLHPLPALRGWAMSPDLARFLVEFALTEQPENMVEIGSGSSTVLLAAAARARGGGHVTALEHLEKYAAETEGKLAAAGLTAWATVIHAELSSIDIDGDSWTWYDVRPEDLPDEIGLLVVDGPPQSTGPHARYPALPVLRKRLADNAIIVLDDYERPQETELAQLWLDRYPEIRLEARADEKGTAILSIASREEG